MELFSLNSWLIFLKQSIRFIRLTVLSQQLVSFDQSIRSIVAHKGVTMREVRLNLYRGQQSAAAPYIAKQVLNLRMTHRHLPFPWQAGRPGSDGKNH